MLALLVLLVAGGMAGVLLGLSDVRIVLSGVNWPLAIGGILVSALAYGAIGHRFLSISQLVGARSPKRLTAEVGYVSTTMGRVLIGGGTAGNILRIMVLRRHGVAAGEAVAMSLLHAYLNFVLVLAIFFAALGLVLVSQSVDSAQATGLIAAGSVVAFVVVGMSILVLSVSVRDRFLRLLVPVARRLTGKDISEQGRRFHVSLHGAISTVRKNRFAVAVPAMLLVLEGLAAMTVLWITFVSLGVSVDPKVLVAGFGIGGAVAMASMLPGGIGVQEGSMAGVFALLGVDFDNAVAVAVMYRVVYFFVPFAVSLFFYRRMLARPKIARPASASLVTQLDVSPGS